MQLANPVPGETGTPTNMGQIVIVANGNANNLYNTYGQWNLIVTDNFGNGITGSNLSAFAYPNGPHPYGSDFYYASSIPTLAPGRTYNVQLNWTASNCTPDPLNAFST